MKKKMLIVLVLVSWMICCNTVNSNLVSSSLPKDIKIVPPDPKLPEEIKAFSGKWKGKWSGAGQNFILIVTEVDREKVVVIYAGDPHIPESYYTAKLINEKQLFQIQFKGDPWRSIPWRVPFDRPWFTFEMQKDKKTLKGICEFSKNSYKATLEKIE
jgi:hypothetical protein